MNDSELSRNVYLCKRRTSLKWVVRIAELEVVVAVTCVAEDCGKGSWEEIIWEWSRESADLIGVGGPHCYKESSEGVGDENAICWRGYVVNYFAVNYSVVKLFRWLESWEEGRGVIASRRVRTSKGLMSVIILQ